MMFGEMKYCDGCGKELKPDPRYSKAQWAKRKYCSKQCFSSEIKHDIADQLRVFESSYQVDNKTGCWIWMKSRCEKGYGMFRLFGRGIRAHRAGWYFHNQEMIPDGVIACHKCDNPPCVNPGHIFLGSQQDNMDDMRKKGRARHLKGGENKNAVLTERQVMGILQSDIPATKLAPVLDVCESTIRAIRQGKNWKHLGDATA
jgi:hypothetical protein